MWRNHRSKTNHDINVALSRNLSLFTITMIGVGGMIGAGIFVLTGIAAGVAGPALVLVFILNGLVTTFTAMSYAELGSAYSQAGGGYLWVKEGMGGGIGFLSGWMDWFAHVVAGSLYALAFGRFATQLLVNLNIPMFGLTIDQVTLILMTVIIVIFISINYRGVSETGKVGNTVTLTKIIILCLFAIFGVIAMLRTEAWHARFTTGFLPNGFLGVLVAMGLTFIAFEGYEIIAQSGEEVVNPKRNVPRAIFLSIIIAVIIYVLVSLTAIGAVQAPQGLAAYQYLGQQKEIAIVDVAQQVFPLGIGGIILLFSGLISTMSALNATTYSSSRVSFAMGRDHNLPAFFANVHLQRHTPYWAVIFSGGLMMLIAWLLPIESVAATADVMFLFLFLLVNLAAIRLRHKRPDLDRGFHIPWFPGIPILGILCNLSLAVYLFTYSRIAWFTAVGWIFVGYVLYLAIFSKIEAMEKPKEILMEEVLVSRDYSVVVPVVSQETASILGKIGTILAGVNEGEVLALNVIKVPSQLTLGEGRWFLKEGRSYLETIIDEAKQHDVPVHTIIRLGRDIAEAINKTAIENAADLVLLGWPGYTHSEGRLYGSIIDPIVENPPTNVAVVRYRQFRPLHHILVPISGGVNSRLAVTTAINFALAEKGEPVVIKLLNIIPVGARESDHVRAQQAFDSSLEGIRYDHIERIILEGVNIEQTILSQADDKCDLIIIGATGESAFRKLLFGNIPDLVAKNAKVTVIIVKRRSGRLQSLVHEAFQ